MDTFNHASLAAVSMAAAGGNTEQVVISGVVAASPDVAEFVENHIFGPPKYKLYIAMHSEEARVATAMIGIAFLLVGNFIAFGFLGWATHAQFDSYLHEVGKRWWIPGEGLLYNDLAWFAVIVLYLFAVIGRVGMSGIPYLASMVVWAIGVHIYCKVKYVSLQLRRTE